MTTARKNAVSDSRTLQLFQHPAFRAAVDRVANAKCMELVKLGRLQIMPLRHTYPRPPYKPRMDLVDDPLSSSLSAVLEIPGVKQDRLSVQIRDGNLVVHGARPSPYNITNSHTTVDSASTGISQSNSQPTASVQELFFGEFYRSIQLPVGIKQTDITASLMDGMLTVTWPRSPVAAESPIPSRTPANTSPPTAMATAGTAMQ